MVPVAQETTVNTVRLPYSFSRRLSAATALRKCSPEKPLSMKFCG